MFFTHANAPRLEIRPSTPWHSSTSSNGCGVGIPKQTSLLPSRLNRRGSRFAQPAYPARQLDVRRAVASEPEAPAAAELQEPGVVVEDERVVQRELSRRGEQRGLRSDREGERGEPPALYLRKPRGRGARRERERLLRRRERDHHRAVDPDDARHRHPESAGDHKRVGLEPALHSPQVHPGEQRRPGSGREVHLEAGVVERAVAEADPANRRRRAQDRDRREDEVDAPPGGSRRAGPGTPARSPRAAAGRCTHPAPSSAALATLRPPTLFAASRMVP